MGYPVQRQGWDPFGELQTLRRDLNRLLGGRAAAVDVDVEEDEKGWTITARLPGVAPEEVAVELEGRELCIRARSEAEVNADLGVGATGSQRRSFDYRVTLPTDFDPEQVDATMDHGLLTVRAPRSAGAQRRQIAVGRRTEAMETTKEE
jgi:HSP20 family protein